MMNTLNRNSDFLFGFEANMTNPNGDPDQENRPRMDYETATLLVSDGRRKRDCRDLLKNKGYEIFVDTLADTKVPMETMFDNIINKWLSNKDKMDTLFKKNNMIKRKWEEVFGKNCDDYKAAYDKKKPKSKNKKDSDFNQFNNILLTEIIKQSLIDIRLFGSAMAIENVTKTFTGPVQISWGYSLHPVEIVKSNSITSIMNDDSSTFGKKYKVYYALVAHYGTMNKYSAKHTGMTEEDASLFRKALVQSIMANQTDSKQGQQPLFYIEVVYKPEFDGYLGDMRRFLKVSYNADKPIRSLNDVKVDFKDLTCVIDQMKQKGYVDEVIGWVHPYINTSESLVNMPIYKEMDLWTPIPSKVAD
ncbi:CRISPR-associated protein, Csh2 family [Caldanaerobius fijiensis DSM 17918]|uniref:CRISPR-associated protein, Csh2 family n=2 Tax=Caldanaerobius TaxID=862261 RepID=A0A1M5BPT2_9THEO|nr:CRISPR-associated protein, Csh2 family [Caldanaerobius fijiensis DSM 17918]